MILGARLRVHPGRGGHARVGLRQSGLRRGVRREVNGAELRAANFGGRGGREGALDFDCTRRF